MRNSHFKPEEIGFILRRQAERGTPVPELARSLGITEQRFYGWKRRYGTGLPAIKDAKNLREENARLQKRIVELTKENQSLADQLARYQSKGKRPIGFKSRD